GDVLLGGAFFTGLVPNGLPSGGLLYSAQFDNLDPGLVFTRVGGANAHHLNAVNSIGYYDDTGFIVLGQGPVDITRAVDPGAAHRPACRNQPRMSSDVTLRITSAIASYSWSLPRALARRRPCFTFENISSIGLYSGLYGGKGNSRAPACSTAAAAPA